MVNAFSFYLNENTLISSSFLNDRSFVYKGGMMMALGGPLWSAHDSAWHEVGIQEILTSVAWQTLHHV